jgi:hypothetical protein
MTNPTMTATEEKRWRRMMAKKAQEFRKAGLDDQANELVATCSQALQEAKRAARRW